MTSVGTERWLATPSDPTSCYVENDEQGQELWKTHIDHFHDKSSPLSHTKRRLDLDLEPRRIALGKAPYENLDELVSDVYEHHRKDLPAPLSRKPKDGKPGKNQKYYIAHSATNCDDLIARVGPSGLFLRGLKYHTGLDEDTIRKRLQTQHILLKNGIRGSYETEDGVVKLENTISGSWDRNSDRLQMARRVAAAPNGKADPTAASDYYTGRPDTMQKAEDLAEMVFFGELKAGKKGKVIKDEKTGKYTLNLVVHSLQATSPSYRALKLEMEQEQDYVANEQAALKALEKRGHITFKDPQTGIDYEVQVKPILFSRQVNAMSKLSHTLSSPVSGTKASLEVSRAGWIALKDLANRKLKELNKLPGTNEDAINQINTIIKKLDASYNLSFFQTQIHPADEMLCIIMLCRLLELPEVIHCKGSTDRTNFALLSTALRQWIDLGLRVPRDITLLLNNPDFKELFAANWASAGHAISRYDRAPHGTIKQNNEDHALDHEVLRLSLNSVTIQNPLAARCLPERYLKKNGALEGTKDLVVKAVKGIWNKSYKTCSRLMGRASKQQKEFSAAFRETPAEATRCPDYNQKFKNRFLSEVRPAQEVIYADMTSKIINGITRRSGEKDDEFFIRRQDELWDKFVDGIEAGFTYTINGRSFEDERITKLKAENREILEKQKEINERLPHLRTEKARTKRIKRRLNKLETRYRKNLQEIKELKRTTSYDVAVDVYTYLEKRCKTTEQLWRCIASCQANITNAAEQHTREIVDNHALRIYAERDTTEIITRPDGTEITMPKEIPVTIDTSGKDWTMHLETTHSVSRHRMVKDPVTSILKVRTGVNLTSGQGDLAWKVEKHGTFHPGGAF